MKEIPEKLKWANDLKPGDEVYVESRYRFDKEKVESTTKTTITVGRTVYKRDSLRHRFDSWSHQEIIQITPESTARYVRYTRIARITSLVSRMPQLRDPSACTDSELAEAVRVLEIALSYVEALNLNAANKDNK